MKDRNLSIFFFFVNINTSSSYLLQRYWSFLRNLSFFCRFFSLTSSTAQPTCWAFSVAWQWFWLDFLYRPLYLNFKCDSSHLFPYNNSQNYDYYYYFPTGFHHFVSQCLVWNSQVWFSLVCTGSESWVRD